LVSHKLNGICRGLDQNNITASLDLASININGPLHVVNLIGNNIGPNITLYYNMSHLVSNGVSIMWVPYSIWPCFEIHWQQFNNMFIIYKHELFQILIGTSWNNFVITWIWIYWQAWRQPLLCQCWTKWCRTLLLLQYYKPSTISRQVFYLIKTCFVKWVMSWNYWIIYKNFTKEFYGMCKSRWIKVDQDPWNHKTHLYIFNILMNKLCVVHYFLCSFNLTMDQLPFENEVETWPTFPN
jgi:hypothetical protein